MPARAGEVLREEGLSGLRVRALDATVYRRLIMVSRPLEMPAPDPPAEAGEVDFSFLGVDEAPAYALLRPDSAAVETERRLLEGHRCLVGRRDGELVHARWFSSKRLDSAYLGLSFELCPKVVYAHDVFTAAGARRLGISVSAPRHYRGILWEEGVRILLGSIWQGNVAGLRMVQAHGHQRLGALGALRLGRLRVPVRRQMPAGYVGSAHRFDEGSAQG